MTKAAQSLNHQTSVLEKVSRSLRRFIRLRALSRASLAATFELPPQCQRPQSLIRDKIAPRDC